MGDIYDLKIANGYWYMATVYSKWRDGLDDACKQACMMAGDLMKRGIAVYSPIAHCHPIAMASGLDPYSHEVWLAADKPMFEGAYGLLVIGMQGWRESFGIGEEIKWAREHKKPRFLVDPRTFSWQALP